MSISDDMKPILVANEKLAKMITDDKPTVRNKKLLEQLREEGERTNGRNSDNGVSSERYAASGRGGDFQDEGRPEGAYQRNQGGTQGNARLAGIAEGRNSGIRPLNGASEYAGESLDSVSRQARNHLELVETPEDKEARQRELTRQRVQRFRDARRTEKAEREAEAFLNKPENVALRNDVRNGPQFHLKNPFNRGNAEKVKLFGEKEAKDELERMTDVYFRGSALLDDVLEIVVKDHEPVQIWQLSHEEAEMLAEMHLERAKKDTGAARSARVLLELYDRFYRWFVLYPRLKATGSHIVEHKGFSFR